MAWSHVVGSKRPLARTSGVVSRWCLTCRMGERYRARHRAPRVATRSVQVGVRQVEERRLAGELVHELLAHLVALGGLLEIAGPGLVLEVDGLGEATVAVP